MEDEFMKRFITLTLLILFVCSAAFAGAKWTYSAPLSRWLITLCRGTTAPVISSTEIFYRLENTWETGVYLYRCPDSEDSKFTRLLDLIMKLKLDPYESRGQVNTEPYIKILYEESTLEILWIEIK
jgi:hypothetical protein